LLVLKRKFPNITSNSSNPN